MVVPLAVCVQIITVGLSFHGIICDLLFCPDIDARKADVRNRILSDKAGIPVITGSRAVFVGPGFLNRDQVVFSAGAIIPGVVNAFS